MKKSRMVSGTERGLLRLCKLVLPAILAISAAAVPAQQNSLVGQWRGVTKGITSDITLTLVFQPNGQYSQLAASVSGQTTQSGPYKLVAPNTVILSVTDWAPKTQQIYHPTGTVGGYYTTQRVAKPSGGTFAYVFNGPNSMTLTDQVLHGSITMTRVQ